MPAPKYNDYWKLRKRSGCEKTFESEDEIIDKLQEYIDYCEINPITVNEMIKAGQKAGEVIAVKRPRIPSFKGFALFLGITENTLYTYKTAESHKDFHECLTYVKDVLDCTLLDNATTGEANPMLTARILKLKDSTDITSNDQQIGIANVSFVGISSDELREMNNKS